MFTTCIKFECKPLGPIASSFRVTLNSVPNHLNHLVSNHTSHLEVILNLNFDLYRSILACDFFQGQPSCWRFFRPLGCF